MDSQSFRTKATDICFSNSLKEVKSGMYYGILLHLIQFIAMLIMIPIDLLIVDQYDEQVLSFFIAATCVAFLNMSSKLIHLRCFLCDPYILVSVAEQLNHIVVSSQSDKEQHISYNSGLPVSSRVYNVQTNLSVDEADQAMKKLVERPLSHLINISILSKDPFNKCITTIGGGCSFALFIYGIIIMSTLPVSTLELTVMIIFCVSQFLIQIRVFLCLIFIALMPLLCILICIYACLCGERQRPANLPQPIEASLQIIQRADGSPCSICFQNIMISELVIVLPCSQKHIFHDTCIKGWTNVKSTCPICRYDLSQ